MSSSTTKATAAAALTKRRETLRLKKNQQEVQLHAMEKAVRPQCSAMSKALENAAWIGAAPTGSRRRGASVTTASEPKPTKQPKNTKPAVIVSEQGDDAVKTATTSHKRIQRRPAVIISDDESDAISNEGESSSESEEGTNDLQDLDPRTLSSTLQHERIQWKQSEEENEKATTASKIEDFSQGDYASNGGDDNNTSGALSSRPRKIPGKREVERRAEPSSHHRTKQDVEVIDWDEDDMAANNFNADHETSQPDDKSQWGPEARYVPGNGRIISIKAQPKVLAMVISIAIRTVTGDAIFQTAYPSADSVGLYHRKTLVKAAKNVGGASEYVTRFKNDHNFGIVIGRVLSGRLSNYRGQVKTMALAKVEGFYNLTIGVSECKKRVESLLLQTTYMYPRSDNDGRLLETKPFHHPAIISTIRDMYFGNSRSCSLADKHKKQFKSSVDTGPRKDEKELPAAMVAMVATAIHSALDDYSSGNVVKTEFKADLYEDVYKGHIEFLETIREGNLLGYHRLMADLYALSSSVSSQRSSMVTKNVLTLLNLAAMDV